MPRNLGVLLPASEVSASCRSTEPSFESSRSSLEPWHLCTIFSRNKGTDADPFLLCDLALLQGALDHCPSPGSQASALIPAMSLSKVRDLMFSRRSIVYIILHPFPLCMYSTSQTFQFSAFKYSRSLIYLLLSRRASLAS